MSNMEQHTTDTALASPPLALAVMALEMETTVAAVEELVGAGNVFMAGGLRSVTGFKGRQVLEEHHRRKAEAEAEAEAASQRAREEALRRRESQPARAIADRANPESRVQQFGLQTVTINPTAPMACSPSWQ
jgi:hypothetical protein